MTWNQYLDEYEIKSIKEILKMLVDELVKHVDSDLLADKESVFFNEKLGDTSFLLAGLLEALLKDRIPEWNLGVKWIDDSLITGVNFKANRLTLDGLIIWGKQDTTEQWVDPFSFKIDNFFGNEVAPRFIFFFCDKTNPEITYEEHKMGRSFSENKITSWRYVLESEKTDGDKNIRNRNGYS